MVVMSKYGMRLLNTVIKIRFDHSKHSSIPLTYSGSHNLQMHLCSSCCHHHCHPHLLHHGVHSWCLLHSCPCLYLLVQALQGSLNIALVMCHCTVQRSIGGHMRKDVMAITQLSWCSGRCKKHPRNKAASSDFTQLLPSWARVNDLTWQVWLQHVGGIFSQFSGMESHAHFMHMSPQDVLGDITMVETPMQRKERTGSSAWSLDISETWLWYNQLFS